MEKVKCFVIVICLLMLSCSHDNHSREIPEGPTPEISLSEESVAFTSNGGTQSIMVAANTNWKIAYEENDWYIAYKNGGAIMINARPNHNSSVGRIDKILVTALYDNIVKEITITQHSADSIVPWINNIGELYQHNKEKITITQGLWGTLLQREGDCMPTGGWNTCRIFPVQRDVLVYEYTTFEQVVYSGSPCLYSEITTPLIATTTCDEDGFFELELEPGKYSVLVMERGFLYANLFDGIGGINPVTIESAQVSIPYLCINYAAD